MFTYQATLNNGHTFVTSDVTELGTATFSNAVYTGQEQSGTITIKGTLKQRHSIIGRYQDGELQDNCVFFFDTLNLVADVAFSNPIMSIQIKDFPTCSLSDMNAPTSDNGMLTGGSIYVTLGNGSSQVITGDQVKYEADQGITDTSYSKMVTITATYNNMTAMGNMTITNPIIFMGQSQEAYIPASYYGQAHTTILLEHFANRISIKYANGAMEPITPQALRIVNQADADKLYVPNIRDDSAMTSPLTYAYPDDTLTTGHGLFVAVYKDTREGSNHRTITSGALRYWVVNAPKEFEGNTIVPLLAETDPLLPYLTSVSTIPHSVKLMNGRYKTINITEFAPIPNVQTATEYITATVSVTYTENNQTISGEIYVHVYNPVTAITGPYTDPGNITVTNTSAITSQQLLNNPGLVRVQFHNGLNGVIAPKSFSGLDEVKIEDATLIKQFDIIAQYCTPYGGVNCTSPMDNPVKVILLNPVIDATINVTEGSVSNPIVLSTVSKTAKLNATLYHSNGATEMATNPIAGPCTLYKSGTMNSTEEATNQEEGDVETTLTVSRNSSSSFNRMDAGKATAISTPSWRINKGVKLYWINKPASITVTNISCNVEKHTVKKVTPSATVTVTYENGAIATDKSASAEPVDNITKRTFKEERNPTVTYEASNGHLIETTCTFYLENPIVSIRYAGESEKKLSSSSITINSLYVITWKNERYNTLGDEETEKWGKLVLNITSTDRNISVTNNNTTSPTVKYTGKNTVTTIKCVATWNNAQNDEIGGLKTCTHTITIINEPSFYHNYHSMPSSTRADNLMLTTPVEDGGMTFSPTISLTIRGANGVVMDTVSVFTTESFYKVQGIYEFTSQENGTETNTFSESVCKSATFVYTYNGYRLSTVISCYPRNSVDTYEYKASEPTYKSNGDSYYSASEFTFTAYCYDVFDSGATRYVGTETNQRTSAFYLLYSTSTETIYPHVTKLNSGTVSKHVSSVPHSTVSYKTHYAVELGNISHERYVNGVASGRHDFHPAQITAFSDEYNTYASPFKRF